MALDWPRIIKVRMAVRRGSALTPAGISVVTPAGVLREPLPLPADLPLLRLNDSNTQLFGSLFDRGVLSYIPSFELLDDPEKFRFHAEQTDIPLEDGTGKYKTGKLTIGIKKTKPRDLSTLPQFEFREIPINNLQAWLNIVSKADGIDKPIMIPCSISKTGDPNNDEWQISANILGKNVFILYQNLIHDLGATIKITFDCDIWREVDPSSIMSFSSVVHDNDFSVEGVNKNKLAAQHIDFGPTGPHLNLNGSSAPDLMVMHSVFSTNISIPLLGKFGEIQYQLKYSVSVEGGIPVTIIRDSDLLNFDEKQTEFSELKVIDKIDEKYPSVARLYLGRLSHSIVVIPKGYVILRREDKCSAFCNALLDTPKTDKFQFLFTLTPNISGIDLIKLWQEINKHEEIKGFELKLPKLINLGSDSNSNLVSAFPTSAEYSIGPEGTFLLSVVIKESTIGPPASSNTFIFTNQLCNFISGIIDIKLDDTFSKPIEVPVLLDFKDTEGSSPIEYSIDESSKKCILKNISPFDLHVKRVAFITPNNIATREIEEKLLANREISLSLSEDTVDLNVIVDFELSIGEALSRNDLFNKYVKFDKVDVRFTRYAFTINGTGIDYENPSRKIDNISIQVTLNDTPETVIPLLKLSKDHAIDSTEITIPIHRVISTLSATLLCSVKFANRPEVKFTLHYDFSQGSNFILEDSSIPPI